ncbi:MAG: nucleoside-triphosphatase [Bacteroidota bacterium]
MSERYTNRLSETWLQAAVVGSLWASFEIIIGSFLHNLRVPFAGTMLSFASVGLIIAFVQVWKSKGLVWRAGLIAALLKSISPSAIILGPMVGIFTEAIIIELFIILLGRNILGYLVGGALAVLSALLHKIVSLLITYGFDLVIIVEQLYLYIIRKLGMTEGDPVLLISIIMLAYVVVGLLGAVLGYLGGKKAIRIKTEAGHDILPDKTASFFKQSDEKKSSPWLLLVHIICIVGCLYLINILPFLYSLIPSLAYASYCLYAYKGGMRSFRKPSFWIWFMAITILAAVFWNGLSKGNLWDAEGLIVGLKMNLRAIVILTGFAAFSRELRNPIIRTVLYHHGFANVYHSVGLAFSVLPGIIDSLPGLRKLVAKPIESLGFIVRKAADVYPALKNELNNQTSVVILTGEVQEGKTGFLLQLISLLKAKNLSMSGLIAKGVHDDTGRTGYDLTDLNSGDTIQYIRNKKLPDSYRYGKYYFSAEGQRFGEKVLNNIDAANTQLIVIDEIGPVELKGKGWAQEIERLVNNFGVPHLWVVRKQILKKAIRQWNVGEVMLIDIRNDDVEESAEEILAFLSREQS